MDCTYIKNAKCNNKKRLTMFCPQHRWGDFAVTHDYIRKVPDVLHPPRYIVVKRGECEDDHFHSFSDNDRRRSEKFHSILSPTAGFSKHSFSQRFSSQNPVSFLMRVTCSAYRILLHFIILIIWIGIKLKEESDEMLRLEAQLCSVLQIGHFGK